MKTMRIIGLCLLVGVAMATPTLLFWHRALMTGQTGTKLLYFTGTASNRIMVVRDSVYSEQNFTLAFLTTAAALAFGLLLISFARPIARLVSSGHRNANSN